MIKVTNAISLNVNELLFDYVQSSGPGGQNVNKVASAVQLRFDVENSLSLPEDVRTRLRKIAGKRITEDGVLIIEARRFRSQDQNKQDAVDRLVALIRAASEKPKIRKRTHPTLAAHQRRLDEKKHHGEIKRSRRLNDKPPRDFD